MKYSVGQKVKIRSLEWYRDNVNRYGIIECGKYEFFEPMNEYCGKVVTIKRIDDDNYRIDTDKGAFCWTDEMIEGLVEELLDKEMEEHQRMCDEIMDIQGIEPIEAEMEQIIHCPEGYIFKDENGNVINATKIVLEKVNTLKTQSDNMETCRGYYTTEEETTNESKKVAWFTFGDNDFADKVELDLSNRELIQEDSKWFVVKKKKEYPKTYDECCEVLSIPSYYNLKYHTFEHGYHELATSNKLLLLQGKLNILGKLLICRDAYWKIAGEEMGLGKPWEPDWENDEQGRYMIMVYENELHKDRSIVGTNFILVFPTEEMRDAFYENFKEEIESCKELL